MLPGLLFLFLWGEARCLSLKPSFLHRRANRGHQQLPNSKSVFIIKKDRLIDTSEFNFKNPRQKFLFGSVLEWCEPLNQPQLAETRRLNHLGPKQCPWELHQDKEKKRRLGCEKDKRYYMFSSCVPMEMGLELFMEVLLNFGKIYNIFPNIFFCDSFWIKASCLTISGWKRDESWGQGTE